MQISDVIFQLERGNFDNPVFLEALNEAAIILKKIKVPDITISTTGKYNFDITGMKEFYFNASMTATIKGRMLSP